MDVLRTLGTRVTAPALMLTTCREADMDQGGITCPQWPRGFTTKIQRDPQCTTFWGHDLPKLHLKQRPLESSPS